ncbi:flavodoxin domain-containing protein [Alkalispirochaeta alkalica]|uniref:flavodoxin domain-containing protein n=1 Tax=Alkalispirochaeta alkalica TaxID=46356 RepID=UPI00035FB4C2|nr:flavodoxin domain-containing protein [Alkalispirochaeta alkalica]
MKTLIVYGTRYGATEKAAHMLAGRIHGEIRQINLAKGSAPSPADYDLVLVGGSVYGGSIQKEVVQFCTANRHLLLRKPLGLFVCCGEEHKAREYLQNALGADLVARALALGSFGYEFDYSKMNILFRLIVRVISKTGKSEFNLREEAIRDFAAQLPKS